MAEKPKVDQVIENRISHEEVFKYEFGKSGDRITIYAKDKDDLKQKIQDFLTVKKELQLE